MQTLAPRSKSRPAVRPEVDRCASEMVTHLPAVLDFFRCRMRQSRDKALSVPQYRALVRIERRGTLTDVAAFLGVTLPSASRLVSGLVAKGYLDRVECPVDRRVRNLSLTPRGQRAMQDTRDATRHRLAVELVRLSDADCRGIAESLRQLGALFADEGTV